MDASRRVNGPVSGPDAGHGRFSPETLAMNAG